MSFKTTLFAGLMAATFAAPAWADIEVHDAYARSSNPMAGAAFMVIHNHGEVDDRIVSVTSDAAARVELHTHIEDADGVMRMVHVEEGMALPAGGEIIMKRGAEHVMFMGLTDPFEQDEIVTITFQFENADDLVVEIPVDQDRVDAGAHGGHGGHGDHGAGEDQSSHDH
ncbi:copper chaperone PCu(A)C [Pseudooctadecabacter jejudonensis]|uniref:Copper chaperone PCu(A)C n=1 Tax=Pseudooctadecabacter jejudonensis TaxID=1391910 RepID=A0A1Y5SLG5_9RHOB|nr:copper chaperone PCu(A)C [Pseudooctadecabacter jejudonensis]SLN42937.1 hypothetical protein PSJ8397_02186 [Pseudooctadecabacter jejudonensis]